jgi:hypothetical protein
MLVRTTFNSRYLYKQGFLSVHSNPGWTEGKLRTVIYYVVIGGFTRTDRQLTLDTEAQHATYDRGPSESYPTHRRPIQPRPCPNLTRTVVDKE